MVVVVARDDHALILGVVVVFEPACGEREQLLLLVGFDRDIAARAIQQCLANFRCFANVGGSHRINQAQAAQQAFGGVGAAGDVVAIELEGFLF